MIDSTGRQFRRGPIKLTREENPALSVQDPFRIARGKIPIDPPARHAAHAAARNEITGPFIYIYFNQRASISRYDLSLRN